MRRVRKVTKKIGHGGLEPEFLCRKILIVRRKNRRW